MSLVSPRRSSICPTTRFLCAENMASGYAISGVIFWSNTRIRGMRAMPSSSVSGIWTLSIRKTHHFRRRGPSRLKVCCPQNRLCVVPVGQVKLANSRAPARKGWPGTATNTDGNRTLESVSIGSQWQCSRSVQLRIHRDGSSSKAATKEIKSTRKTIRPFQSTKVIVKLYCKDSTH